MFSLLVGYQYRSAAVVSDHPEPDDADAVSLVDELGGQPGTRLPHAWVQRAGHRVRGQAHRTSGDQAHDAHCKKCGSLLYSVVRNGAWVHLAMGTLIDEPTIRPQRHIFVGSKAPWFTITDDLPQHHEHMTR